MREDFASISSFIMNKVGETFKAKAYFENVKDGFRLPAIYFPLPEELEDKVTLNHSYISDNTLFIQVFAVSDDDASSIAHSIVTEIHNEHDYIPVLTENGEKTGKYIFVYVKKITRIEASVVQIQIDWKYFNTFDDSVTDKVTDLKLNLQSGR